MVVVTKAQGLEVKECLEEVRTGTELQADVVDEGDADVEDAAGAMKRERRTWLPLVSRVG